MRCRILSFRTDELGLPAEGRPGTFLLHSRHFPIGQADGSPAANWQSAFDELAPSARAATRRAGSLVRPIIGSRLGGTPGLSAGVTA